MAIIDVTEYMYSSYSFPIGAQNLINILIENVGKQHDRMQSPFNFSGDGWSIIGNMMDTGTKWIVNIEDDTLAVLFKLKWL